MVAQPVDPVEPTRRTPQASQRSRTRLFREAPLLWRALLRVDRALILLTGRLEVTGDVPDELRGRPLLLASNHVGNIDALVVMAACGRRRLALRFLATGGLFDTPVLGSMLRHCHHVRADRGKANAAQALDHVVGALEEDHRPVLVYPEGRISLEPGLWPERGKTGVARMALAGNVPVVTISQWGAHEAVYWGTETVTKPADFKPLVTSFGRALVNRPTFRVHFGEQVDLSDLSADRPGDAMRAHKRIMQAITDGLVPLRQDELDRPRFHDPTRPTDAVSPWRPAP